MKISCINNIVNYNNLNSRTVPFKRSAGVSDVFVRRTESIDNVVDCAKSFKKFVIEPFRDWIDNSLPEDGQKGSYLLGKLVEPYIDVIKKYDISDTEKFVKLTLGEDTAKVLNDASASNSTLRLLKETVEEKTGKTIIGILQQI